MSWILLSVAVIAFIELARKLHILHTVTDMTGLVAKVARTVQSEKVSDHWKERALLLYSRRLLALSAKGALSLLICFSPLVAIGYTAQVLGGEAAADWTGWPAVVGGTVFALIYLNIRDRFGGRHI